MVTRKLKPLDEQVVRRVAHVIGPFSAAAQAVADFEKRTASGEKVTFYQEGNAILVGPDCREAATG